MTYCQDIYPYPININQPHFTSPHSLHFPTLHFTSLHFTSLPHTHFTSLPLTSLHFPSLHFIPYTEFYSVYHIFTTLTSTPILYTYILIYRLCLSNSSTYAAGYACLPCYTQWCTDNTVPTTRGRDTGQETQHGIYTSECNIYINAISLV